METKEASSISTSEGDLATVFAAWSSLVTVFGNVVERRGGSAAIPSPGDRQLVLALDALRAHDMERTFVDWLFDQLHSVIRTRVAAPFWKQLEDFGKQKQELDKPAFRQWVTRTFTLAVHAVYDGVLPLQQCVSALAGLQSAATVKAATQTARTGRPGRPEQQRSGGGAGAAAQLLDRFHRMVHTLLFSAAPPGFLHELLFVYFDEQFALLHRARARASAENLDSSAGAAPASASASAAGDDGSGDTEMKADSGSGSGSGAAPMDEGADSAEADAAAAAAAAADDGSLSVFQTMCTWLQELRWLGVCEHMYSEMLYRRIADQVASCTEDEDTFKAQGVLSGVMAWIDTVVCPWLHCLLCPAMSPATAAAVARGAGTGAGAGSGSDKGAAAQLLSLTQRASQLATPMFQRASTPIASPAAHGAASNDSSPSSPPLLAQLPAAGAASLSPLTVPDAGAAGGGFGTPAASLAHGRAKGVGPVTAAAAAVLGAAAGAGPASFSSAADAAAAAAAALRERESAILFQQWRSRLQFFAYERFSTLRIGQLFSIIRDFPESQPALDDLKACLEHTNQSKELVRTLGASMQTRLLQQSAATKSILDLYISTIRALRFLDPSGVTLEAVGEPIRKYLRGRTDTVRSIVTNFDAEGSELKEELESGEVKEDELEAEDEKGDFDLQWQPDPVDADPLKSSRSRKSGDLISTLVGIYGSKELFVHEFRTLLADKLLSMSDYKTDEQVKRMELLKLRFGDASMHLCEVMVKDVDISKKTNSLIKDELQRQARLATAAKTAGRPGSEAPGAGAGATGPVVPDKENAGAGAGAGAGAPKRPAGGAQPRRGLSVPVGGAGAASAAPAAAAGSAGAGAGAGSAGAPELARRLFDLRASLGGPGDTSGVESKRSSEIGLGMGPGLGLSSGGGDRRSSSGLASSLSLDASSSELDLSAELAAKAARQAEAQSLALLEHKAGRELKSDERRDRDRDAVLGVMDAVIVSKEFWPELNADSFTLPPAVQDALDRYGETFTRTKAGRTVDWLPSLGTVTLEIEVRGEPKEFNVTPLQASIISQFAERHVWPLAVLAESLSLEPAVLRTRINYWLTNGVLREVRGKSGLEYHVIETLSEEDRACFTDNADGQASDTGAAAAGDGEGKGDFKRGDGADGGAGSMMSGAELARHLRSFVDSTLQSFTALPLERLHQQARVHQAFSGLPISEQLLLDVLNTLVEEKQLAYDRATKTYSRAAAAAAGSS